MQFSCHVPPVNAQDLIPCMLAHLIFMILALVFLGQLSGLIVVFIIVIIIIIIDKWGIA